MENTTKKRFTFTTEQIAVLGVLMGLRIALSRVSVMIGPNNRLSFGFIIAAIIGLLFGPWVAGFSAIGTDLLTSFLFGQPGGIFIGFTFSAFVGSFIYGLFLHRKKIEWYHVLGAVLLNALLTNLILNTLWVNMMFKTPILALLPGRILNNVIMGPVRFILIYLTLNNKQLQTIFDRFSIANK